MESEVIEILSSIGRSDEAVQRLRIALDNEEQGYGAARALGLDDAGRSTAWKLILVVGFGRGLPKLE